MTGVTLFLGIVTMALGLRVAVSPESSARIWGNKQFDTYTPTRRTLYLRGFRTLGLLLCLAGLLVSIQGIWFRS